MTFYPHRQNIEVKQLKTRLSCELKEAHLKKKKNILYVFIENTFI